jgi:hypothetical protein
MGFIQPFLGSYETMPPFKLFEEKASAWQGWLHASDFSYPAFPCDTNHCFAFTDNVGDCGVTG